LREAKAEHEWSGVGILMAQNKQAEAELALLDDKLARTRITAPFDGIVVSGDLSQSLGAPVERGEVLFEIAPLASYRVVLKVDERDIEELAVGQRGLLSLASMPADDYAFVVENVTPVATAAEGKNFFRVEAALEEISERLRPGMEGVAKIGIGERRLVWIWTHRIIDWFRLWFWSWWP
jgi:multidrug resistance efflux pump